jgi:hypothetical protein
MLEMVTMVGIRRGSVQAEIGMRTRVGQRRVREGGDLWYLMLLGGDLHLTLVWTLNKLLGLSIPVIVLRQGCRSSVMEPGRA